MKTFYKIVADELSVLDMFNSMWNTKYKVGDMVFDNDVVSLSSNNYYKLYQAIEIFNDNCEYGKIYLEEL
jgi:hypothetical protein